MSRFSILSFALFSFVSAGATSMSPAEWNNTTQALLTLLADQSTKEPCIANSYKKLGRSYAIESTTNGAICKMYDMGFPHLMLAFRKGQTQENFSHIRIRSASEQEVLSYKDDEDSITVALDQLRPLSKSDIDNSWISEIDFNTHRIQRNSNGLPQRFKLSEIKGFRVLNFSSHEKSTLKALLIRAGADSHQVENFTETPKQALGQIEFILDPIKNIYKVALDFDFLPISGPISQIDHSIQYRSWVQSQIRSVVLSAVLRIAQPLSGTVAGRLLVVALTDTFEVIDLTYQSHLAQLEMTLQLALQGKVSTDLSPTELQNSLYLVHAQSTDVITQIILAKAQGKQVDFNNLYSFGKDRSLSDFRARKTLSDRHYSELSLGKQCQLKEVGRYLASCDQTGRVYSLLDRVSFLFWDLGPTTSLRMDQPRRVQIQRSGAYLLATAVQMAPRFLPNFVISQVVSALKNYALSGAVTESMMVAEHTQQEQSLGEMGDVIMKSQVNPLMPRSTTSLDLVIQKNWQILKGDNTL